MKFDYSWFKNILIFNCFTHLRLQDKCNQVRYSTLITIIDLIRQEMIKVRGQIAGIAKLLVDEEQNINCMFIKCLGVWLLLKLIILITYRHCKTIFWCYCRKRKHSLQCLIWYYFNFVQPWWFGTRNWFSVNHEVNICIYLCSMFETYVYLY